VVSRLILRVRRLRRISGTTVTVPSRFRFVSLSAHEPFLRPAMFDVRLDRCRRYVRKLHAAEERDRCLIRPSASVNDFLSFDLVVRDHQLCSIGDGQILNDNPVRAGLRRLPKSKSVLRLLLVRCLRGFGLVQTGSRPGIGSSRSCSDGLARHGQSIGRLSESQWWRVGSCRCGSKRVNDGTRNP